MSGPGDGGINADDALRIPALVQQAAYIWNAQPQPVPVPQVALVESVDRDDKQLFSGRPGKSEPKSEK